MKGVVGTVIDIKSLLCVEPTEVKYSIGNFENIPLIKFRKDRKYYVPYFQREIRWDKRNVITLIGDLFTGAKFLGNIILTEDADGNYEILDGQQRITTIVFLYLCIKKKFGDRLPEFKMCDFQVKSFEGLSILIESDFQKDNYESRIEEIDKLDDYKQAKKYISLWNEIYNCERLEKIADAEIVLKNLSASDINVIINKDNREESISRFLDVNLKGVKLDKEDIFKSYLYAQDARDEIHKIWSEIKKKDVDFSEKGKAVYPLMVLIEHYFTCKIPTVVRYKSIHFNSDFELLYDTNVEEKKYIQGAHILTLFKDKAFVMKCMNEISALYDIFIDIVGSSGPGVRFKEIVNQFNKRQKKNDKLDDNIINIIHNLTKKMLMDKEKVPKCLLVKYFMDTMLNNEAKKRNYTNIYTLSTFYLVFSLFQNKKGLDTVSDIVYQSEWIIETCKYVTEILGDGNISNRQILAAYRFCVDDESEEKGSQQYKCKTLAMIYNYLDISENDISVRKGLNLELLEFITNSLKFSVEHFMINESGTCIVKYGSDKNKSFVYSYPKEIKKMRDYLYNYIFISQENNNDLGNANFSDKLSLIVGEYKEKFENEKCEYTKLVIETAKKVFTFPDCSCYEEESRVCEELNNYFIKKFREEYALFAREIVAATLKRE